MLQAAIVEYLAEYDVRYRHPDWVPALGACAALLRAARSGRQTVR
jgi:hypothetical protein